MSLQQRFITLVNATGEIRTAQFEGRDHIVVPVVALVEGVIHAMNAKNPELVLAEEFSKNVGSWNGRPVMPDHPIRNGVPVSANDPEVLESECIGRTFNAHVDGPKLCMEAWIDKARAEAVGEKGISILERTEKKEMIEISVGVFVTAEKAEGKHKGVRYAGIWRNPAPDHLALLSEKSKGACSNEMGCGAPRVAAKNLITAEGVKVDLKLPTIEELQDRIKALGVKTFRGAKGAEGMSDGQIRSAIYDALFAVEPGFLGIDAVFSTDKMVVYATMPEGDLKLFRRSFSVADDGTVTVADKREEVRPVTRYEPVVAEAADLKAASCGCQKHTSNGEKSLMTKEQRIAALLGSKKNNWTQETHGAFLEACSEEQLTALEAAEKDLKEIADPVAPPPPAPEPPKTLEAYVASAPKEFQAFVREGIRAAEQKKTALMASIKAAKGNRFNDAQLQAKEIDELEAIAALAGVDKPTEESVDFSAAGGPRAASTQKKEDDRPAPAPTVLSVLQGNKK